MRVLGDRVGETPTNPQATFGLRPAAPARQMRARTSLMGTMWRDWASGRSAVVRVPIA